MHDSMMGHFLSTSPVWIWQNKSKYCADLREFELYDSEASLFCCLALSMARAMPCFRQPQLLIRICSDSNIFELRAKERTDRLNSRGYLKQDIASAIDKVRQKSRYALLPYRLKSTEVGTIFQFVFTYHPDLSKARRIVDKSWSMIKSSSELGQTSHGN